MLRRTCLALLAFAGPLSAVAAARPGMVEVIGVTWDYEHYATTFYICNERGSREGPQLRQLTVRGIRQKHINCGDVVPLSALRGV